MSQTLADQARKAAEYLRGSAGDTRPSVSLDWDRAYDYASLLERLATQQATTDRIADAVRQWVSSREWDEDCTCDVEYAGQCWYWLTPDEKSRERFVSFFRRVWPAIEQELGTVEP